MGSFVCTAFGLCLDQVVGCADWSHTFWSCDLGRNGGDLLCGGILSLLPGKRCDVEALDSWIRYITHQYKQVQKRLNGDYVVDIELHGFFS